MDFTKCVPFSDYHCLDTLIQTFIKEFEQNYNCSLQINSAYRTPAWETSQGRDGSSAHCLGKAIDVRCPNNIFRYNLVKFALQFGINRIGIYKTYVHLDCATAKDNKTTNIIWYG